MAENSLWPINKQEAEPIEKRHGSIHEVFISRPSTRNLLGLEREKPWRLPSHSSAASAAEPDTIKILAMRFDFVKEDPDDPLTTGDGTFDMRDFDTFYEEEGYLIDAAPHDTLYFSKHLEALNNYYRAVSESTLVLTWEIYPKQHDSVYHLPNTMGYYGAQHPNLGLGEFYYDCITLVDENVPEIIFADFDSYFLIHAGADQQNNLPFVEDTPHDLYTGFIRMAAAIPVDGGTHEVVDGLMVPETRSQDNRVVALNAVLAHEFGHQLGLVDLYGLVDAGGGRFAFVSRVGDFALMDNMGRGTVIDPDGPGGHPAISDMIPVYLTAWSRAFLGFIEPVVYREAASIELVAAEMVSTGIKAAKIPISEFEYFLLENRQQDTDGDETQIVIDDSIYVAMGPGKRVYDPDLGDSVKVLTGEYDDLLPGSGILIWHVDESAATRPITSVYIDHIDPETSETTFVYITSNRFDENRLQSFSDEPFIQLVEADGLQDFFLPGLFYTPGYEGVHEDMYYSGNNTSLTPNSNPSSEGFTGVNSDIYITGISASGNSMSFSLGYDFTSEGFPRRVGYPVIGLSPIAADLDDDDTPEIIIVSDSSVAIVHTDGSDF